MTHSQRTQLQDKRLRNSLAVLTLVLLLSACRGASDPTPKPSESAQNQPGTANVDQLATEPIDQSGMAPGGMATTGTIVIEERNGKTVFDAFFSHNPVSTSAFGVIDRDISPDVCSASALHADGSQSAPVELGAANSEAAYKEVGAALIIESRVGQFEALIKQQAGDLTVYAPDARWQSATLPDDAVLSFETTSTFDDLGTVELPPLQPLVWLAPETGVMTNPASSLRWEASFDEQVQIRLRLSAIDFSNSQNPVVITVSCNLTDDGLFDLPVEFQRLLPDDEIGIVVYAVRERVQEVQIDNTSLTVVQLSYPAPL